MKIVDNREENHTRLDNVPQGTVFEYNEEYYIKTNEKRDVNEHMDGLSCYVVNLFTGVLICLSIYERVSVCDAELHLQ